MLASSFIAAVSGSSSLVLAFLAGLSRFSTVTTSSLFHFLVVAVRAGMSASIPTCSLAFFTSGCVAGTQVYPRLRAIVVRSLSLHCSLSSSFFSNGGLFWDKRHRAMQRPWSRSPIRLHVFHGSSPFSDVCAATILLLPRASLCARCLCAVRRTFVRTTPVQRCLNPSTQGVLEGHLFAQQGAVQSQYNRTVDVVHLPKGAPQHSMKRLVGCRTDGLQCASTDVREKL